MRFAFSLNLKSMNAISMFERKYFIWSTFFLMILCGWRVGGDQMSYEISKFLFVGGSRNSSMIAIDNLDELYIKSFGVFNDRNKNIGLYFGRIK